MAASKLTSAQINAIDWTQNNSAIANGLGVSRQNIQALRQSRAKVAGPVGRPTSTTKVQNPILEAINNQRKARSWTITDLARAAEVKPSHLSAVLAGKHRPRLNTIDQLLIALDAPPIFPQIQAAIAASGFTQTELAAKLGIVQPQLNALISGTKSPYPEIVLKLMRILHIPLPWSVHVR